MLTPGEIIAMSERNRDEWLRAAKLATWVRSTIWGKQQLHAEDLLGWSRPQPVMPRSPKKIAELFEACVRESWENKGH